MCFTMVLLWFPSLPLSLSLRSWLPHPHIFPEHKRHHAAEQKREINLTHAEGSLAWNASGELSKTTTKFQWGMWGEQRQSERRTCARTFSSTKVYRWTNYRLENDNATTDVCSPCISFCIIPVKEKTETECDKKSRFSENSGLLIREALIAEPLISQCSSRIHFQP